MVEFQQTILPKRSLKEPPIPHSSLFGQGFTKGIDNIFGGGLTFVPEIPLGLRHEFLRSLGGGAVVALATKESASPAIQASS